MTLDRHRVENITKSLSDRVCIRKFLREFFASANGSRSYNELDAKVSDYICYSLKSKS